MPMQWIDAYQRVNRNILFFLLALLIVTCAKGVSAQDRPPTVQPNNNLTPAGRLEENRLHIDLVAEAGMWYPGGPGSHGIPIQAFREANGPLQIPAPLVRVPQNTEIELKVYNNIQGSELQLNGFQPHPSETSDQLSIPYGETRTVRFNAGAPGAYLYWATTTGAPITQRFGIDSQLSGAFIVDDENSDGSERVLVLGEYQNRNLTTLEIEGSQFSVNGLSWPQTERLNVEVGKTNRWHIVNGSLAGHPMHLHGVHYRVAATGSITGYHPIPPSDQREVVTELVGSAQTMTMEWKAANAGNWLFHCHIVAHVDGRNMVSVRGLDAADYDPHTMDHMSGMTVGIHASGNDKYATTSLPGRRLTMQLNHVENHYGNNPGIAVAFNEKGASENPASIPGPPLFLNRDELISIEVVNNLPEPTSIHWHGMELQSYFDGVAGFGGHGASITPPIGPGQTFEVLMKPPRAGTFIYHTHLNDEAQLSAGLYGAMIVSAENRPFDSDTDRLFVIGLLGESGPQGLRFDGSHLGINGSTSHQQQFTAGQSYRLRILNIADNNAGLAVWLNSAGGTEKWTPIAQDGADLPESYRKPLAAERQRVSVGETLDFQWLPPRPGNYWLEVRRGGNGEFMGQALLEVLP